MLGHVSTRESQKTKEYKKSISSNLKNINKAISETLTKLLDISDALKEKDKVLKIIRNGGIRLEELLQMKGIIDG